MEMNCHHCDEEMDVGYFVGSIDKGGDMCKICHGLYYDLFKAFVDDPFVPELAQIEIDELNDKLDKRKRKKIRRRQQ